MISLCGASEILEVLRRYFNDKQQYNIIGYGSWNDMDNDILQCTLCPEHIEEKHLTPYTIHSLMPVKKNNNKRICPYKKQLSMTNCDCNYHHNLNLINLVKKGKKASTNRIIRCYEGHRGGRPNLLYRFDWERPIVELDYSCFKEMDPSGIAAIVIEDHGKGVVNDKTIEELINAIGVAKSKKIKWYIRSKIENPEWLEILKNKGIKLRLKVIDHKLAQHMKGPRRWRFNNKLGRSSLELLGELTGDSMWKDGKTFAPKNKKIHTQRAAVIFDDNTVIAKDDYKCFNINSYIGPDQLITIGRTTMFFIALIAQDLSTNKINNFGIECFHALQCGYEWIKKASSAWSEEDLHFYGDYATALDALGIRSAEGIFESVYDDEWDNWNNSSIKCGVLELKKQKRLEVWRGEGIIERYICVGGPKRNDINKLVRRISQFNVQHNPKHPFNCLLVSSPGWGKSFLANCIAKHFDMNFQEFSLAQMANSNDLVDCFDTICSLQGRSKKKVLVFLDEINCEIEGHSAMGLLLSPIWNGSFIKDGRTYQLSPAVWIFASTSPIDVLIKPNKGSDFLSRLNGLIVDLDYLSKSKDKKPSFLTKLKKNLVLDLSSKPHEDGTYSTIMTNMPEHIRTEHVYLGVSLLNTFWGPISKIQEEVLQLFYDILPINGFRSLEFYISKCHGIQRGAVVCSNMPSVNDFEELKRHVVLPELWDDNRPHDKLPDDPKDSKNFVEIITLVQ